MKMKEVVQKLSGALPNYRIHRQGRANSVCIYLDRDEGTLAMKAVFPRKTLSGLNESGISSMARMLRDAFDRAIREGKCQQKQRNNGNSLELN